MVTSGMQHRHTVFLIGAIYYLQASPGAKGHHPLRRDPGYTPE